jgi:acetyltransferase-like isoleucine patch superfamily enzyme
MRINAGTTIHPMTNVYCESIGNNCRIANFVEIGRGVTIGNFCSIQAFAFIPEGVTIGSNVFIGPHVCFINCRYPMANRKTGTYDLERTIVEDNVVIGAGSIIMCGITLAEGCMIGAGSLVLNSVQRGAKIMQKRVNI